MTLELLQNVLEMLRNNLKNAHAISDTQLDKRNGF